MQSATKRSFRDFAAICMVVLGSLNCSTPGPVTNWRAVTSGADDDMNDWRDAWFARVVEDRIRTHGRRALLFVGGAHIARKVMFPNSLIHVLDERLPGETFVVSVIDVGGVDKSVALVFEIGQFEWRRR